MSQYVFLAQYNSDSHGKLYEEGGSTIESTFISSSLIKEIEQQWSLLSKNIYEEQGFDDSFSISCFDDEKVKDICSWLEGLFLRLFSNKLSIDSNEESTELVVNDLINKSDLDSLIEQFRTVTNLIKIFRLKSEKYRDDHSVVLKLG